MRETPEAAAARKEKRDQQNINITLYVASLLLVAAGALFVGTSLPALFRFVGIWFITALFYVAGHGYPLPRFPAFVRPLSLSSERVWHSSR